LEIILKLFGLIDFLGEMPVGAKRSFNVNIWSASIEILHE